MAQRGQFKPPSISLREAVDQAADVIDSAGTDVALFMVAGKLRATRRDSEAFDTTLELLPNNLIGVYNAGVDARQLKADIGVFYGDGR